MKKIILLSALFIIVNSYSQKSIFFFKKDTVFITYDTLKLNSNILRKSKEISIKRKNKKGKIKKREGTVITYNFLDSLEIKRKEAMMKYWKNNPGVGMHGTASIHFGIHFRHTTLKNIIKFKDVKKEPIYKIHKKLFDKKKHKTHSDSLAFDELIFRNVLRFYQSPNTKIKLTKAGFKNKKIIHLDGSTKIYEEIKIISKEPVYIYILDKIVLNKCDNKKYYYFNEVALKSRPIVR